MVKVEDLQHQIHPCRALLDNGSMSNFITLSFCKRLNLKLSRINYTVSGVGAAMQDAQFMTYVKIRSNHTTFNTTIFCIVLRSITTNIPSSSIERETFELPAIVKLADPSFYISQPVDLLLGANVFWQVLGSGHITIENSNIMLHETALGWVFGGVQQHTLVQANLSAVEAKEGSWQRKLEFQIRKFWEVEEVNRGPFLSKGEQYCEDLFERTIMRDESGKFVVKVPFKENLSQLGQSKNLAMNRFLNLEKRLKRNPHLYSEYGEFMREYLSMGHMTEVSDTEKQEELHYYIPHQAVVREDSCTTKLRVVFNASMKTDSGLSLNDVQYPGPAILNDLFDILLNFRLHNYVMSADVSKMYRMIWIQPADRKLHKILWRWSPSEDIKSYELNTLTYGTASAPYLAIRCLQQLADEIAETNPEASRVIKKHFFMDDLLSGAPTTEKLLQLQRDVSTCLASAGMDLRKWLSNNADLQNQFSINSDLEHSTLQLGAGHASKTLGVRWDSRKDTIQYATKIPSSGEGNLTKRVLLSQISQIFDPLGLLGPIILRGKVIIQKLWSEKLDWDDDITPELEEEWRAFRYDLNDLKSIEIPRQATAQKFESAELHGFGDASELAYGATVYLRTSSTSGKITSRLLCAKSKVAPLKTLSIPRLELCSALLLAELMKRVKETIEIPISRCSYWSDSMDALSWIKDCPSRWKTFVANRVSLIQTLSEKSDWNHVSSADNPADLISRGATVTQILQSQLWWTGPHWLKQATPTPEQKDGNQLEVSQEVNVIAAVSCDYNADLSIFERFSSYSRLIRATAYIFRFYTNCKKRVAHKKKLEVERLNEKRRGKKIVPTTPNPEYLQTGNLTIAEITKAERTLVTLIQRQSFPFEYHSLSTDQPIDHPSRLLNLNPIMKDNVIRVGGRVHRSDLPLNQKHPMILPPSHKFTRLLCEHMHEQLRHCGPTLLLSAIRERFWILQGRNIARQVVRKCISCFRARPKSLRYKMGNLPECRVKGHFPFQNVGVDYAGPFLFKDRKSRGPKMTKGYICLFVCMATKAIHLETVSDLTTECFMACFRRFIARRGKPANVYSDNGKNFVGADASLKEVYEFLRKSKHDIYDALAQQRIQWHFIPPRSPNFGGLWEAGIKSVKHHLRRTIGNTSLHFEDFNTVLTEIEGILNSRPLCPLTTDPDDLEPLTPGHFLIGRSIVSLPEEENYQDIPDNRLKWYARLQKMVQQFWSRWRKDYINELQTRSKWSRNYVQDQQQLEKGALVLVKNENLPPNQWPLGRITELFPGEDGIIRVVELRWKGNKIIRRSITNICVLPKK